jgi:phospholipid transport system transporter-binding protein
MIACEGERCALQGPVTMHNVTAVLAESARAFKGPRVVVDLGGVTDVDSAAVSLLLEWRRAAAKENRSIEFSNMPPNLKSLAELYGVSHLIGAR